MKYMADYLIVMALKNAEHHRLHAWATNVQDQMSVSQSGRIARMVCWYFRAGQAGKQSAVQSSSCCDNEDDSEPAAARKVRSNAKFLKLRALSKWPILQRMA